MLEEELEVGITVLALVHAGEIDFNCSSCNSVMANDLHCSGEAEYPIMVHGDYEFYSCPLKWLNNTIYEWYDEYSYYEVYPNGAPNYKEVNIRYWECVKLYKSVLNKSELDKINKKKKPNTSDESLSKLRQGFKRKNDKHTT